MRATGVFEAPMCVTGAIARPPYTTALGVTRFPGTGS
jgi:hypothetical protein